MKKMILTAAIALIGMNAAQAQTPISIRPEVGINLANQTIKADDDKQDTKMLIGIKGGAYVKIPIVHGTGLYIEPGILYSMKGVKATDEGNISILGISTSYKNEATNHLNYFELPVNIGYNFDFSGNDDGSGLFITAGPYIGYAFSGKSKFENTTTINGTTNSQSGDEKIDFGSDSTDMMKPLDFGLNFSLGYQIPMGLYIRAQYGLGLSNLSNVDNPTIKNNVISFSIGYDLPLGGR